MVTPRRQAVSDLIEPVALEQTALAHILNAEGEKLQRILSFEDLEPQTMLRANHSVESMVNTVSRLEIILRNKLEQFRDCGCR